MVANVICQILWRNGVTFSDPIKEPVPCDGTRVISLGWARPVHRGGFFTGYAFVLGPDKPSNDSIHVIHLEVSNGSLPNYNLWIAIGDNDTEAAFVDKCNACCGEVPEMDAVAYPPIIDEVPGTPDGDGNYVFKFPMPDNPFALGYTLEDSYGGAFPAPYVPDNAINTPAELLTYLNANRATYGAWTFQDSNKILVLTATNVTSAGVQVGLNPVQYCYALPNPAVSVASITIGGDDVSLPNVVQASRTNPQALYSMIKPFLVGKLEVLVVGGIPKIRYTGIQVPSTFKDAAGTTVGTFAAGDCS